MKSKTFWIAAQHHSLPLHGLSRGRDDGRGMPRPYNG